MSIQQNNKPYFSIMVPTYNQAHYLPNCLNSLIAQNFPDWEAIVVDDGSTDETSQVLEVWKFKDPRVHTIRQKNGGTAAALNTALKNCKGEWICWLSSDDLFEPDKLEVHKKAIETYPDTHFFHTHFYHLEESTGMKTAPEHWRPIPEPGLEVARFFSGNYVSGITVCIQRDAMLKVGRFRTDLRHAQDFAFWLDLSCLYPPRFIDRRTAIMRWHEGQTTNGFPVAGLYDSAWACIDFLNSHPFEELFPTMDLNDPEQAEIAVKECVSICLNQGSFIYQLGYLPALMQRAMEWVGSQQCVEGCKAAKKILEESAGSSSLGDKPEEIQKIFQFSFNQKGAYQYRSESAPDFIRQTIALPCTENRKRINLIRYLEMKQQEWKNK